MESIISKLQIGLLEGKTNWSTWKYKVCILLKSIPNAIEVIEGKLIRPVPLQDGAGDADICKYKADFEAFVRADSSALLLLTTNMRDDALKKVMRYTTAQDVWMELHRLFDGVSEDRSYNLCMSFFGFKRESTDDIATHLSKLKNIWTELNQELSQDNKELPELLLICKILDTLGEEYFSFRSSWLLVPKSERNVESLTSHLCAYERTISSKQGLDEGVFGASSSMQKQKIGNKTKGSKDANMKCNYCYKLGHRVRNCPMWIKDGKPPKKQNNTENANMMLMSVEAVQTNAAPFFAEHDRENWWVDNGATSHITNRSDLFQKFEYFDAKSTVTTANGDAIQAKGKGSIIIEANVNGKMVPITLQDVWYVPTVTKNLFSVLAVHDKIPHSSFTSNATKCSLSVKKDVKIVGKRCQKGGLYKLDVKNIHPAKELEVFMTTETQVYHERLGHQNKRYVRAFVKRELGIELPSEPNELCEGCINGKAHRLKFSTRTRATKPGELLHADVCGPIEPCSFSKYRYFLIVKDDYTKFCFVYLLREKSEVPEKVKLLLAEIKTTGNVVQEILSDNGGEFNNKRMRDLLQKEGIRQRLVCPYTPEQNGCAERENRTVVETARAMMYAHKQLPIELWAELVNTAVYILNRTGPTQDDGKTPYELWYGKKESIKHLRIIGSTCYALIPNQKRKKLHKKSVKGVLIGYDQDGYRIWVTEGKKHSLLRSRDVIFDEKALASVEFEMETTTKNANPFQNVFEIPLDSKPTRLEGVDRNTRVTREMQLDIQNNMQMEQPDNIELVELERETEVEGCVDPTETELDRTDVSEAIEKSQILDQVRIPDPIVLGNNDEDDEFVDAIEPRYDLRNRSTLKPPAKFEDYVMIAQIDTEPLSYRDAIQSSEKTKWHLAMEKEIDSLKENNTWTLKELPKGRKAIPVKWVFKIKRNSDGSVDRYKARLVVKGFCQRKGSDYEETFSPVARMATIRSLISVAASERMYLTQFDVTTAFLNGCLNEDIYIRQPEGFEDGSNRVCHLNKSLYGLKQAPRCWNICFHTFLKDLCFEQSTADPCLYIKAKGDEKIILTLYVDDGLIAASDQKLAEEFLSQLKKKLKITTNPATFYLGIEIERCKSGSIVIKQEAYTKKILERFGMGSCNPVTTPIDRESLELGRDEPLEDSEESFPYREAVGALAYLMVGTRPDIAYAVGVASRKLESPTRSDWLKVKRIMRYLKGTTTYGIKYQPDQIKQLEAFSDADHGGDAMTGRSTTGVVCCYAGGAISWLSQRQVSVAISTTEAELVAASEGARELIWLKRIYEALTKLDAKPTLSVDNEAAIRLAHNPEFHRRTKHIRIRHFFVRELVAEGDIEIVKVSSSSQLADTLTKALSRPNFVRIRENLGLTSRAIQ